MKSIPQQLTAVLTVTALLAGCSTYRPRIEPEPMVELQASFLETGVEAPNRWWEDFGDPGLAEVIETTLDDNLSLRMAWTRLDQMRDDGTVHGCAEVAATGGRAFLPVIRQHFVEFAGTVLPEQRVRFVAFCYRGAQAVPVEFHGEFAVRQPRNSPELAFADDNEEL